jgi:type IV secretory pathway VirB2 component (pilin)
MSTLFKIFLKTLPIQALVFLLVASNAHADGWFDWSAGQNTSAPMFGTITCKAYNCFLGSNAAIAFSSLAIFVVGMMALLGKVNWNMAVMVTLGMVLLSGSAMIVEKMNANPIGGIEGTIALGIGDGKQGCPSPTGWSPLKCN